MNFPQNSSCIPKLLGYYLGMNENEITDTQYDQKRSEEYQGNYDGRFERMVDEDHFQYAVRMAALDRSGQNMPRAVGPVICELCEHVIDARVRASAQQTATGWAHRGCVEAMRCEQE